MPRPPRQPRRDEIPADELADYDAVVARRVAIGMASAGEDVDLGPYFGSLANSPPFAAVLARFGTLVRTRGERSDTYSHADRELVDQVLQADWKTNVVQLLHVPDGLAAGVRLEAIEALRGGDERKLTPDERQLADYIRRVESGTVTDEAWDALVTRMGTRGAVEYTVFIAFLIMTIRLHQAFGFPDPSDEEIDALVAQFRSGARELPNFKERIG